MNDFSEYFNNIKNMDDEDLYETLYELEVQYDETKLIIDEIKRVMDKRGLD